MKIAVLDGGNKLIYKNKDEYTIKTTIGNFNDVNEVIKKYPEVKNSKNVKKCEYCNKYFIVIGNRQNRRKYCSDLCSKEAHRLQKWRNQLKRKNFYKHQNQRVLAEYKKNKGKLPTGFTQIDTNKTMGETILWESIPKKKNGEYNWEKEHRIIKKLKRDLYKNNIVNP